MSNIKSSHVAEPPQAAGKQRRSDLRASAPCALRLGLAVSVTASTRGYTRSLHVVEQYFQEIETADTTSAAHPAVHAHSHAHSIPAHTCTSSSRVKRGVLAWRAAAEVSGAGRAAVHTCAAVRAVSVRLAAVVQEWVEVETEPVCGIGGEFIVVVSVGWAVVVAARVGVEAGRSSCGNEAGGKGVAGRWHDGYGDVTLVVGMERRGGDTEKGVGRDGRMALMRLAVMLAVTVGRGCGVVMIMLVMGRLMVRAVVVLGLVAV